MELACSASDFFFLYCITTSNFCSCFFLLFAIVSFSIRSEFLCFWMRRVNPLISHACLTTYGDIYMRLCFSEVGLSPVYEISHSDPHAAALDRSTQLWWVQCIEWTPFHKKILNYKTNQTNKKKIQMCSDSQQIFLSLIVVLQCMCVVHHLHIEGVLFNRALAEEGWGEGGGNVMGWGQRSREGQRSKRSMECSYIFGLFFGCWILSRSPADLFTLSWSEIGQFPSSGSNAHQLCSYTYNYFTLFVHTTFF